HVPQLPALASLHAGELSTPSSIAPSSITARIKPRRAQGPWSRGSRARRRIQPGTAPNRFSGPERRGGNAGPVLTSRQYAPASHPRAEPFAGLGKPMSGDTTVKKVKSQASPHGEMDQSYLVSGKR